MMTSVVCLKMKEDKQSTMREISSNLDPAYQRQAALEHTFQSQVL